MPISPSDLFELRRTREVGVVKLTGTATMHAAPDRVWAALNDPAVLAAAIPGCERLEPAGPDAYQFTIAAGVGSLQGTFTGRVAVSDRREPDSFVLTATGSGGPGTVSIRARFALAAGPDGSTELGYDADGEATGLLGRRRPADVHGRRPADGQRVLRGPWTLSFRTGTRRPPATPSLSSRAQFQRAQFPRAQFPQAQCRCPGSPGPGRPRRQPAPRRGRPSSWPVRSRARPPRWPGSRSAAWSGGGNRDARGHRRGGPGRPAAGPLTAQAIEANIARALAQVRDCVAATGAELVVLPESVTTGFTTGLDPAELWDLVSAIPGPIAEPFCQAAAELGIELVFGSYERGPERGVIYNAAAIAGRDGCLLGVYRKTHLFGTERADRGGWVTPGDDICVVDTGYASLGLIICFDGDYPELSQDHRDPRRRDHLPPVRAAALGRPVGADQPGPRLRQPRLRDRRERHRH